MENRSYILDRLKSKAISIDEFNYDRLEAPPIAALFTPQDIAELNYIAKSLKYSAKPHIKYQEIDKIMRRRGFEKFIAGTNRVVYRPLEDNRFLVKVAADAVGLGDNPREYKNQFLFKPFVTKVFEITPCGTLGIFERVVPITSREEFLSISEDIFTVINDWFLGEYVMEDIGTRFFMNWGIRKNFGPVLLDFPYVYKLDGDKLFCNSPSNNSPSGCCEGVIDYDPGYNFLYCTKCGVKYKAKELAQAIEQNNVIVKSEGEFKMKVRINGGSKNVEKEIITGQYSGVAKSTPCKPIKGKNDKKKDERSTEKVSKSKDIANNSPRKDEKKKEVINPIEFDESLIKKDSDKELSNVEKFTDYINKAVEILNISNMKDKAAINEVIFKSFEKEINKTFEEEINKIIEDSTSELKDTIEKLNKELEKYNSNDSVDEEEPVTVDQAILYLNKVGNIFDKLEDEDPNDCFNDDKAKEFLNSIPDTIIRCIFRELLSSGDYNIILENKKLSWISDNEDFDNCGVRISLEPKIVKVLSTKDGDFSYSLFDNDEIDLDIKVIDIDDIIAEGNFVIVDKDEWDNAVIVRDNNGSYNGIKYYAAKVVNTKDVLPNEQASKVIMILDNNGNYLTTGPDNDILSIDVLEDKSVDSLSVVSTTWLDGVMEELDNYNNQTLSSVSEEDEEEVDEDYNEQQNISADIPTGVLPPDISVNGVPTTEEEN